jgi:cytochrome b561
MQFRNTPDRYGWVSIVIHWVMAVLLAGLFVLGKYMISLNYYDPQYLRLPDVHRGIGVFVALLLVLRFLWRQMNPVPRIYGLKLEKRLAPLVHRFFYLLLLAVVLSGYLVSTAGGHALNVFGWFELPALIEGTDNLEDRAGQMHDYLTWALGFFVSVHVGSALKHHFIDNDFTLRRMLGFASGVGGSEEEI